MKKAFFLVLVLCGFLNACDIPESNTGYNLVLPHYPEIRFTDLGNQAVSFGQILSIDVDGNFTYDFTISTALVESDGESIQQYKFKAAYYTFAQVNNQGEMPGLFSEGHNISPTALSNFSWRNNLEFVVLEKVTPVNGQAYWRGSWSDANEQYVPLMFNARLGWIKISFDRQNERLTLHNSGCSMENGIAVKAGIY